MADVFWLSDDQWAVVGRFMPTNQPGARRVDDRRVVSGILHMLRTGGRQLKAPATPGLRLDAPSVTLAMVGGFALVYPLIEGREHGWPAWSFALLGVGLVALAAFGVLSVLPVTMVG